MRKPLCSKLVLIAAFAILGIVLAENAYTQPPPAGSWFCSKNAQCKDFVAACDSGKGTCKSTDTTSAVGCLKGTEACAVLDTGTNCTGICSTTGKQCPYFVPVCGNPK